MPIVDEEDGEEIEGLACEAYHPQVPTEFFEEQPREALLIPDQDRRDYVNAMTAITLPISEQRLDALAQIDTEVVSLNDFSLFEQYLLQAERQTMEVAQELPTLEDVTLFSDIAVNHPDDTLRFTKRH